VKEPERVQSVASETAVLVRVISRAQSFAEAPLEELEGLATTAGTTVVNGLTQRRETPDRATYVGKGKLEELRRLVDSHDADVVIFDNDLSPAQTRNLEKALNVKVIDRTELILDIFASNAKTHEARLAVELAQLEYSLPRLKRMWTHLSRMKMGVGMRGPGEKQLEVDRRLVEKRIHDLRGELRVIETRKERQVAARSDHMTVCLVGYTNAGKSTLMNALTEANVVVEDKLFATLDTRTRRWQLPSWGPVLLSDTVGFIRDLPHRLIASFKATLEEARQADLLLHIADASNAAVYDQISAAYAVLQEIGIEEKDTLLVVNKIDRLSSENTLGGIINRYPNAIPVSAQDRIGFEQLAYGVSDALSRTFCDVDVETGVENGKLVAYLSAHGEVLSKRYEGERVVVHCRIPQKYLGRIKGADTTIRKRDAGPQAVDDTGTGAVEDVA
jgi:GTP-binding protein HflX